MDAKAVQRQEAVELAGRMPLAEAVLTIWRLVFDEDRLDHLWNCYRGRCYQKVLSFGVIVHLVADALLQ